MVAFLCSCDPGHAVVISNHSTDSKHVAVVLTNKRRFQALDSITIVDSPNRYQISVLKDVSTHSYSFILEKGTDAILQQGIGAPDLSDKIIINNNDTIALDNKDKVRIQKQGISTLIKVDLE